ncbi:MAG: serine/threonine protein kinase [Planctomycetales bacterium]|nr:serine/threonine protein kinase [Planctomycetales bacterium]
MQLSRIGPFALEEPLGGADSNVLRGVHVERGVSMAVKLLDPRVIRGALGATNHDLLADVKRLQKVAHPGVVRHYGGAIENGQPYLALEYVDGESLRALLDRRGRLPWEMVVDLADSICLALHAAHRAGVVHRRLTPDRVLLPAAGGVKLIGFDCAWADADEVVGLRCPMKVAHYLSPEQFRGHQSAALPACDLYSLGVILYECLTGELPWPADSPTALKAARRETPAPRISTKVLDCPVWLDVLVSKLLARKRVDRLASAEVTHSAIVNAKQKAAEGVGAAQQALAGKSGALAMGASQADRAELKKIRRRQTHTRDDSPFYERAWFLALCLAAVIGGAVWSLWPASEAQLWAKAAPLMQSDSAVDWRRAKDDYLSELLQRFPETEHRPEIEAFELKYAMNRAEERIKNLDRFGRTPETEAERLYAEARRYERFGDRVTAWQRYEGLVNLLDESDDLSDRAFVELAKLRIGEIRAQAQQQQQLADFVAEQLAKADELAADNQTLAAREVLTTVISLYDGNQELEPLVDKARQRKAELDGR